VNDADNAPICLPVDAHARDERVPRVPKLRSTRGLSTALTSRLRAPIMQEPRYLDKCRRPMMTADARAPISIVRRSSVKSRIRKRARRLGAPDTSGTGTRSSSVAQSTPTPKKGTPSPGSPATGGAWNDRSFGPSTSSASSRTDAGIVPRPHTRCRYAGRKRFRMTSLRQIYAYQRARPKARSVAQRLLFCFSFLFAAKFFC